MESKKKHHPTYTPEFRERGVRLYREHRSDYTSDNAAYRVVATGLRPIQQPSKVSSYARPRARQPLSR